MTLIEDLLTLYRVERQLRGLRKRVDSAETYLSIQQRQLNTLQERQVELETHKRQRQAHAGNLETEAESVEERAAKLRDELNESSNTRQYQAVLNEVNSLKDKRKEFDEQGLAELTAIEKIEEELGELKTQITERTKVLNSAQEELTSRKAEIKESLAEIELERAEKAAVIPGITQELFDNLADDFEGEAMASIQLVDKRRREYACDTCNVHLPFDVVNRVTSRPDEVVQCQGCLRILYASDDCREALVK